MVAIIFFLIILLCMIMSVRTLFLPDALQEKYLSWQSFIYLLFIYSTIMIGFGLVYFLFLQNGFIVFAENEKIISGDILERLGACIYFSGITLFSVGYGDVVPIGIGRIIAIFEGMVGYTIPAAFVVRTVIDFKREFDGW